MPTIGVATYGVVRGPAGRNGEASLPAGQEGELIGYDADGNPVAVPAPSVDLPAGASGDMLQYDVTGEPVSSRLRMQNLGMPEAALWDNEGYVIITTRASGSAQDGMTVPHPASAAPKAYRVFATCGYAGTSGAGFANYMRTQVVADTVTLDSVIHDEMVINKKYLREKLGEASESGSLVVRDAEGTFTVPIGTAGGNPVNRDQLAKAVSIIAPQYLDGTAPTNPPTVTHENHLAIGWGAQYMHVNPGGNQGGGIAEGILARANGLHLLAFGPLAEVGPRTEADEFDPTATGISHSGGFGGALRVSVSNGWALGARARVDHANSVALGSDSRTDAADTVSVGSPTLKRRLTSVGDGTGPADAVTKGQLDAGLSGKVSGSVTIWTGTQAAYDAIEAKSPTTIYHITD